VRAAAVVAVAALAALCGCGGGGAGTPKPLAPNPPRPPSLGPGPRYRPPSLAAAAAAGRPIRGLGCGRGAGPRFGAHIELFAAGRVVLVPPGIGIAPPRIRHGAYVSGGRCSYPARTREPTGLIEVEPGARLRLGDFFAIWGQPLSPRRMAGFGGPVRAYVSGRLHVGDPRDIRLSRHAVIALEVGARVPPHASYGFPPGL
jgi:hypothetical protein